MAVISKSERKSRKPYHYGRDKQSTVRHQQPSSFAALQYGVRRRRAAAGRDALATYHARFLRDVERYASIILTGG